MYPHTKKNKKKQLGDENLKSEPQNTNALWHTVPRQWHNLRVAMVNG